MSIILPWSLQVCAISVIKIFSFVETFDPPIIAKTGFFVLVKIFSIFFISFIRSKPPQVFGAYFAKYVRTLIQILKEILIFK